jgi:hypothetical protein
MIVLEESLSNRNQNINSPKSQSDFQSSAESPIKEINI